MGIPEQLIFCITTIYTSRMQCLDAEHGETNWLQIGKEMRQNYMFFPYFILPIL